MDHSFLRNKKLLLVDDEPELLQMVTSILSDEGFRNIVTAVSAKEGISAFQNEKPDLAILDVMLPDGNGFSREFDSLAAKKSCQAAPGFIFLSILYFLLARYG